MTIIDTRTVVGRYSLNCRQAIVDHPELGRLFLSEGYGGEDNVQLGGQYRWIHGIAINLLRGDTFESLEREMYNATTTVMDAMVAGFCNERPVVVGMSGQEMDRFMSAD